MTLSSSSSTTAPYTKSFRIFWQATSIKDWKKRKKNQMCTPDLKWQVRDVCVFLFSHNDNFRWQMQQNVTAVTMKHPTGQTVFRNKSRTESVGAADLMSDFFILTETEPEPEWTVPTHKYYIKQSWDALSSCFSLSLPHSSEVLQHSSSSQGKTVRLHPPTKFTCYSPHYVWRKRFVSWDVVWLWVILFDIWTTHCLLSE